MEFVIWGTERNRPEWDEVIIKVTTSRQRAAQIFDKARNSNKYSNVRIATINLRKAPDFGATVKL